MNRRSRTYRALSFLVMWLMAAPPAGAWMPPRPKARQAQRPRQLDADPLGVLRLPGAVPLLPRSERESRTLGPQPLMPQFSSTPTDREVFDARVFYEPIVPGAGDMDPQENRQLADTLTEYLSDGGGENFAAIEAFLEAHPDSRWRGALLTNLGITYRRTGYFSRAVSTLGAAWEALKEETDPQAMLMADRALAEYAQLNARLGRMDVLELLFEETKDRNVRGSATEMLSGARQGLQLMRYRPEDAFRCGPMALDRLLANTRLDYRLDERIVNSRSTTQGMSLEQVWQLSNELDMGLRMAKREGGEFIAPAVVHWKANHFAALVKSDGDRFMVEDPTFGDRTWVSREALEEESSGYFLVPAGDSLDGWRDVGDDEAQTVWGKGNTMGQDPEAITSCHDTSGGTECPSCKGMPTYRFHSMIVSLNITDIPVGYSPPIGPAVNFLMTYNQRMSSP